MATLPEIDTVNKRMKEIYDLSIQRIARASSTVLILGESGTGKERLAGLLHRHSPRRDRPFIKINCAALPEGVLESELFGHEKGSFTGAVARRIGRFEQAHTGTIFLDEVVDLTPLVQAKLLRVLQEREFERVGGLATISIDVRVIAATNKPLAEEVKEGRFREDLYYRLNVIAVEIPPLRDRREDIPLLTEKFLDNFCRKNQRSRFQLSPEAMQCLLNYSWPGNIRELENLIERLTVLMPGDVATMDDLPIELKDYSASTGVKSPQEHPETLREAREETERGMIEQTLQRCKGNVSASSAVLGIARKNLQHKIRQYGIEVERYRGLQADAEA